MAHVDLSLSGLQTHGPDRVLGGFLGSLDLWSYAVNVANEPCLLIDKEGVVLAASPGCGRLFNIDAREAVGRRLVDGVLHLLDFNIVSGELPGWEVDKIPPRLATTTGGLARGLMRVRGPGGAPNTVDAISVPLRDADTVVGSLTFFALVAR
jgi:PAS domain-containing protein